MIDERLEALLPLLETAAELDRRLRSPSRSDDYELCLRVVLGHQDKPSLVAMVARLLARAGHPDLAATALASARPPARSAKLAAAAARLADEAGDLDGAIAHALNAAADDPTDATLVLLLADLCLRRGDTPAGCRLLDMLEGVPLPDAESNERMARLLWANRRAAAAVLRLEASYALGNRDEAFLQAFLDLLTGETLYRRVLELPVFGAPGSALHRHATMMYAHAKLAAPFGQLALIDTARQREDKAAWLSVEALMTAVAQAVAAGRPFSAIRFGDGEARFLICSDPAVGATLDPAEIKAVADAVWQNWFGLPFDSVAPEAIAALRADVVDACRTCDALGITQHARFRYDTGHLGYLAAGERQLEALLAGHERRFFDALGHFEFDKVEPSLSSILQGRDVVGVISPMPVSPPP